jgi:hypothetical protein
MLPQLWWILLLKLGYYSSTLGAIEMSTSFNSYQYTTKCYAKPVDDTLFNKFNRNTAKLKSSKFDLFCVIYMHTQESKFQ